MGTEFPSEDGERWRLHNTGNVLNANKLDAYMDFRFLVQHVRSFEAATLSQQTMKAELKNQEVFLDSSEKWGHKANCCPQNGGERKANTENHNWPQQKPVNKTLPRNYCQGRKTWTETNGLLAAQWEQLVDFQNPGGFWVLPSGVQPGPKSEYRRKISCFLGAKGREQF